MTRLTGVVVLILSWVLAGATAASAADPSTREDLADAVRFRTTFGFAADETTVAAAERDRAWLNTRWGVPLTSAEAAEMDRRSALADDLGPLVEAVESDRYGGGVYLDNQAGGVPVVVVKDGGDGLLARMDSVIPNGVDVRVVRAKRSYAELIDLQQRIFDQVDEIRSAGIDVTEIGVDVRENAVVVGIDGLSETAETTLRTRFGSDLLFEETEAAVVDACTVKNCWPPKGGIEIRSTSNGNACTAGFLVRRQGTSTYGIVTAGHCIKLNGGNGTDWVHGTSTVRTVGSAQNHTWTGDNVYADAGIIVIDSGVVPASKNLFFAGITDTTNALLGIKTLSQQAEGWPVCREGRTSLRDCGEILNKDKIKKSCNPSGSVCYDIQHTVVVDFDSTGGDSGGPYFGGTDSSTGYGIHVHSQDDDLADAKGWYSPLNWARYAYEAKTGIRWDFCLNSTCSSVWP